MNRLYARKVATHVILGLALVVIVAVAFVNEPSGAARVHVRERFIPGDYDWTRVHRIAILPIEQSYQKSGHDRREGRPSARQEMLADSALVPLIDDMSRSIRSVDSTITVLIIDSLKFALSNTALIKIAGKATGADVVMMLHITKIERNEATPDVSGGYAMGSPLPPMPGRPASTSVKMTITLNDVESGMLVWQVDAEGKDFQGGIKGSPDESAPPAPTGVIRELFSAAVAKLPL